MIHQGNILKEKVKELRPNLDLFAGALGMTRQNLYNVYARSQIDFITLEKACEFLKIEESLFDPKANKLKKDASFSDKNSVTNEIVEELRTSVEKAHQVIEDLKKDKEFLQTLVMQQFQMLNIKLDNLGKYDGIGGSRLKDDLFVLLPQAA